MGQSTNAPMRQVEMSLKVTAPKGGGGTAYVEVPRDLILVLSGKEARHASSPDYGQPRRVTPGLPEAICAATLQAGGPSAGVLCRMDDMNAYVPADCFPVVREAIQSAGFEFKLRDTFADSGVAYPEIETSLPYDSRAIRNGDIGASMRLHDIGTARCVEALRVRLGDEAGGREEPAMIVVQTHEAPSSVGDRDPELRTVLYRRGASQVASFAGGDTPSRRSAIEQDMPPQDVRFAPAPARHSPGVSLGEALSSDLEESPGPRPL